MITTLFTAPPPKPTLYERFKTAVSKTRDDLVERIDDIFQGKKVIDEELLEELEMTLISADLGVRTTDEILEEIRAKLDRKQLSNPQELKEHIAKHMMEILQSVGAAKPVVGGPPRVILVVGVNGTGKTTTIGKLANKLKEGRQPGSARGGGHLPRGGDRAARGLERAHERAADQAESRRRPERCRLRRAGGGESAQSGRGDRRHRRPPAQQGRPDGRARKDQAHRRPPRRRAPHETLLVLDAVTGQNGLEQARQFTAVAGVTGLVLTKLDGTAKGGIVVAIARELNLPIRYVGVGEKVDDLEEFDAESFVRALFEIA